MGLQVQKSLVPQIWVSQNDWCVIEKSMKMNDLEVPPILGNLRTLGKRWGMWILTPTETIEFTHENDVVEK